MSYRERGGSGRFNHPHHLTELKAFLLTGFIRTGSHACSTTLTEDFDYLGVGAIGLKYACAIRANLDADTTGGA
jgi:hypothetical protein